MPYNHLGHLDRMANSLVSGEENYGFNLEWIGESGGIGEVEMCGGVEGEEEEDEKECIVEDLGGGIVKEEVVSALGDVEDYVEIQVTEEEVVTDQWENHHNGPEEDPLQFQVEDDDVVPLPDQDEYSLMHPYPCDFCNKRFSKKSALTQHMFTHQLKITHMCNLCGARYKQKHDLVEHMKIHAQAPDRSSVEEEYEELATLPQAKAKQRARQKKKKAARNHDTSRRRGTVKRLAPLKVIHQEPEPEPEPEPCEEEEEVEDLHHYIEEEEMNTTIPAPKFPIIDPSRPYVCQYCGVGFAREKALTSHTLIHAGDSAFECERCHEMFHSMDQLSEHSTKHGKQPPSSTSNSHSYQRRPASNSSSVASFGTFQCDYCGMAFHWYNQLKKHRRTHTPKQEDITSASDVLVCSMCNMSFISMEELSIHKEEHNGVDMKVHCCPVCSEIYETFEDMQEHMRLDHKPSFSCHMCEAVFKDAKALSKHSLMHIESRSYPCPVCNRRFHNRGKLKKHMEMHDEQKSGVVCGECGEEVGDGRSLIAHKQSVHHVNISKLFPCLECGKTFSSRSSQQIHVRIHTGEKPYGCKYCWKAFADGGTLRKHERIHTGEKPYVCPVCSKAFNQRVVLREHVRAHHSGTESRLSANCYECIVCGQMFGSSSELCLHLVHHSDENTAKHRLPNPSSGQRTKMGGAGSRRKSQFHHSPPAPPPPVTPPSPPPSHHHHQFKTEQPSEPSDNSRDSMDFAKTPSNNKRIRQDFSDQSFGGDDCEKPMKRARIVRSGKKGYPKGNNKRFMKGKGKAAKLMNSTSYASKYVVSRPEEQLDSLLEVLSGEEPARSRPRTKNVSYHNMKPEKLEVATFPLPSTRSRRGAGGGGASKRGAAKAKIKKEPLEDTSHLDTEYINGIDPSLFEEENHCEGGEQIETCIVDDIGVELKLEVKTSEPDDLLPPVDPAHHEVVSCEMCDQEFPNRSELLKHIQVHI